MRSILDGVPLLREVLGAPREIVRMSTHRPGRVRRDPQRAPVLLIPGLLNGDWMLSGLAARLRTSGFTPASSAITFNVDCSERAVGRLEMRLRTLADAHRGPVFLVGHSRGGCFARVLAVRHPELVAGIITLGSPLRDQLAIDPAFRVLVRGLATAGSAGVPRVLRHGCRHGPCCCRFNDALCGPFPAGVPFLSIYSRSDGVVRASASLDPGARHLALDSTHWGLAIGPGVHDTVADELAHVAASRIPRPWGRQLAA